MKNSEKIIISVPLNVEWFLISQYIWIDKKGKIMKDYIAYPFENIMELK